MEYVCNICPRKCNKIRGEYYGNGICKMPYNAKISRYDLHKWEEPCISGQRGSGTIFFTGCNLQCVYCQNYKITKGELENIGKFVSIEDIYEICQELVNKGAHNINFVTPSHYIHIVKEFLQKYKDKIPVPIVYNTSSYENLENLKELEGLIDVYLPDLKYFSKEISTKYSKAPNYFEIASKNILEMYRQVGSCEFDDDGMLQKGVIVRHLILPNNVKNTIDVLNWCNNNLPKDILISVMSQYTPVGDIEGYPELQRKIKKVEYNRVLKYMIDNDIDNGYIQELSSASTKYIPDFY